MLSAWLMYRRFASAMKVAVRDEGFVQILGTGVLLVVVGTITYATSQHWNIVDAFYFAVMTLTTASIADPKLTITGGPIKIFTVFYVLVGIGILVEVARRLGMGFIAARAEVREAQVAAAVEADPRPPSDGAA